MRLAFLLKDLPVEVLGRLRSDRVLCFPRRRAVPASRDGRPARPRVQARRGDQLASPAGFRHHPGHPVRHRRSSGMAPAASPADPPRRLGSPRRRAAGHRGHPDPADVDHLPGDRNPKPLWLWSSRPAASPGEADLLLRRFDIEPTFRPFRQVLGWTAPKIRDPHAADRWTWLILACHAEFRLARPLAADLRRPREHPAPPGRLTPVRVRRGFRNIRATAGCPAGAPKPSKPGPGRPPGSKNRRPAPRHDVGKTTKRELTLKARRERAS